MRKVACDDNWFLQNGYWEIKTCESPVTKYNPTGGFKYEFAVVTEKWRKLMDTVFRNHDLNTIITPEVLIKTIKAGTSRTPRKNNSYEKIVRPKGYLTTKERIVLKQKEREAKGWKPTKGNKLISDANRNT